MRRYFKTEICKEFAITNKCKFKDACHFAHGLEELKERYKEKNYKTSSCNNYFTLGYCNYGHRCKFKHEKTSYMERIRNYNMNYPMTRLLVFKKFY